MEDLPPNEAATLPSRLMCGYASEAVAAGRLRIYLDRDGREYREVAQEDLLQALDLPPVGTAPSLQLFWVRGTGPRPAPMCEWPRPAPPCLPTHVRTALLAAL